MTEHVVRKIITDKTRWILVTILLDTAAYDSFILLDHDAIGETWCSLSLLSLYVCKGLVYNHEQVYFSLASSVIFLFICVSYSNGIGITTANVLYRSQFRYGTVWVLR
jgi:hypothetical protein